MKNITSIRNFLLSTLLAALALAAPSASARDAILSSDLTLFGGFVFVPDAEKPVFKSQTPPVLLKMVCYDDGILTLTIPNPNGGTASMDFTVTDTFGEGEAKILAFVARGNRSFMFFSAEDGFLEIDIVPDKGIILTPLDAGDTREARAAEMAEGRVPNVSLSHLGEIDKWLANFLSGGKASSETALGVVASATLFNPFEETMSLGGFDERLANIPDAESFDGNVGSALHSGVYTQWGALSYLPRNPAFRGALFKPFGRPAVCKVEIGENAFSIKSEDRPGGAAVAYQYKGLLPVNGRQFRIYENGNGSEHFAVSPDGQIVFFFHVPDTKVDTILFDMGDTRERRAAESMRLSGRFPGYPFPEIPEIAQWCLGQNVKIDPSKVPGAGGRNRKNCFRCHGKGTVPRVIPSYGVKQPPNCSDPGCTFRKVYHIHVPCPVCG